MTDQNKTHGVLTDAEIKAVKYGTWDLAAWEPGSLPFRLKFARAVESAVLAKAAPQSPNATSPIGWAVEFKRPGSTAIDRLLVKSQQDAEKQVGKELIIKIYPVFAAPQSPVAPANSRIETTYEHIARDMREGRFPTRSEPQQVPVAPTDDDVVREQVEKYERAEEKAFEAAANSPRCQYCDGTGDVHSIDGEWRGECTECKPVAPADERAFPGAPVSSVCSTLIGSAPTVSATVPDGWRLVPQYLTAPMKAAGEVVAEPGGKTHYGIGIRALELAWRAMLAAAPTPPTSAAVIDMDKLDWQVILDAASASPWMPAEYTRNDWMADIVRWLKEAPPTSAADAIKWPTMPPSRGQSHVLFEDGYAEGWFKCLESCQRAIAASKETT